MQEKPGNEPVAEMVEQAQEEVARTREPWYRSLQRTRVLATIYLAAFVLCALLATFVYYHPIIAVDVIITQEFQENKAPWLNMLMTAVSWLGSNFIVFALLIFLTALAFWVLNLRLEAAFIAGLSIVSSIINTLLKLIVHRPRPSAPLVEVLQTASGNSFPSGHVMSYVAFFGLLFSLVFVLFRRNRWWHYLLLIIPGVMVVLVGPSRIYLGDHWASDVLGGYMFGGVLLGLALWLYLNLRQRGILDSSHVRSRKHAEARPVHSRKA